MSWFLVAYQTPGAPSTARVSAWRGLHALGGLYLGPSVCLLAPQVADPARLEAIAGRVRAAGGSFEVFEIRAFEPDAEARLRNRYSAARAAEYAEIVERAEALVDELERETAHHKVTFAEVEENEAGLTKIRQWLRRVIARDLFGCARRAEAEAAVGQAEERLAAFTELAVARESGVGDPVAADATPDLRVVRDN